VDDPWFRKHWWFGILPIRREGVAAILAMFVVFVAGGLAFVSLAGREPLLGWAAGIVTVAAMFVGVAVVVWKTERNYGFGVDPRPDERTIRLGCIAQAIFMIVSFVVITLLINVRG
jgi:hypothetical protein